MQKYGLMANREIKEPFECVVCGQNAGFNWSDLHGEGMCNFCGTPYQLMQYDESKKRIDAPPRINVKEEWIPVLRRYWEETHQYIGLGTIMVWRDYPECEEGLRKFYDWLDEHKDLIPGKEEGE